MTKVVITQAADVVGATVASLSVVVDEDTLALVGLRGAVEDAARRWATYPIHEPTPAGDVVRSGELLVLTGREAIRARYPDLESAAEGERSMVCPPAARRGADDRRGHADVPGTARSRCCRAGVLGHPRRLVRPGPGTHPGPGRGTRAGRPGRGSSPMPRRSCPRASTTRSPWRTSLALRCRPSPTGARSTWSRTTACTDWPSNTSTRPRCDWPSSSNAATRPTARRRVGAWQVIRTGRSTLVPEVTDEMLVAGAKDEEHLRLTRQLQMRSGLVVPLVARERVLGVITWVSAESERRYTDGDVAFAEDLGRGCRRHRQRTAAQRDPAGRRTPPARGPAGAGRRHRRLGAGQLLQPGRPHRGRGRLLRRHRAAGRPTRDLRRRRDGTRRDGRGLDGPDAGRDPGLRRRRPRARGRAAELDRLFSTYDVGQLVTLVYAVVDVARDELTVERGAPAAARASERRVTNSFRRRRGAPRHRDRPTAPP